MEAEPVEAICASRTRNPLDLRKFSRFPHLEEVKAILKDRKIDFLFIDGDHSYEGVRQDFEM